MSNRIRKTGQLLIALFALWQVGALLHLMLVPHSVCPVAGEARHVHDQPGHAHGDDGDPGHDEGDDHSRHDGCRFLACLTSAALLTSDGPSAILAAPQAPDAALPVAVLAAHDSRHLYRLSPSHSPPAGA